MLQSRGESHTMLTRFSVTVTSLLCLALFLVCGTVDSLPKFSGKFVQGRPYTRRYTLSNTYNIIVLLYYKIRPVQFFLHIAVLLIKFNHFT